MISKRLHPASFSNVNAQLAQIQNQYTAYGVRFTNASSAPAGTRILGAINKTAVAGVGVDGMSARHGTIW